HNLLLQCEGEKRFWLAPPGAGPLLGRNSRFSRAPNFARADLESMTPPKGDGTEQGAAKIYGCTLQAGQALYIPPGWWHQVRSESAGTSINIWFADGLRAWLAGWSQRYAALRSLRPRPVQNCVKSADTPAKA
ncbi:MAG: cupin-like domain-containing protein, partial [Myxococcota bacterium]